MPYSCPSDRTTEQNTSGLTLVLASGSRIEVEPGLYGLVRDRRCSLAGDGGHVSLGRQRESWNEANVGSPIFQVSDRG